MKKFWPAKPTPEHIFQLFNAYQTTAALKAAIELDLFTIVGQRKMSVADLAGHCQTSERGIRILCDYLVVSELLEKREGRYYLTPESAAFLNRNSPAYLGTTVRFLNSPYLMDGFKDLTPVVRKGGTIISNEFHSLETSPQHVIISYKD